MTNETRNARTDESIELIWKYREQIRSEMPEHGDVKVISLGRVLHMCDGIAINPDIGPHEYSIKSDARNAEFIERLNNQLEQSVPNGEGLRLGDNGYAFVKYEFASGELNSDDLATNPFIRGLEHSSERPGMLKYIVRYLKCEGSVNCIFPNKRYSYYGKIPRELYTHTFANIAFRTDQPKWGRSIPLTMYLYPDNGVFGDYFVSPNGSNDIRDFERRKNRI